MSIASTGLSDHEKQQKQTVRGGGNDDLGGFTLDEFCQLFAISRGLAYKEWRDGRLAFSKAGNRTIITRSHARCYQQLLEAEAEAEAKVKAEVKAKAKAEAKAP
jgi:hypothetical protein